jgi:hypothetical protein
MRRPLVPSQRRKETVLVNLVLWLSRAASVGGGAGVSYEASGGKGGRGGRRGRRTLLLEGLEFFIMRSAELGPFGELVLCAYGVEFLSDSEVFSLELLLLLEGLGCRCREAVIQVP